ncbi:type II secretion system protein GspE [bacterium]|nr:MAG: type II secretion system protein GspE [bacterium]
MALSNNSPAAPAARPQTIAHALLFKNKVSKEQAMDAMKRANNSHAALPGIFMELGISDVDIAEAQAQVQGVPFFDLKKTPPSEDARNLIPDDLQTRLKATGLRIEGDTLIVALDNPKDFHALEDLQLRTKMRIRAVIAAPSQLEAFRENGGGGLIPTGSEDGDGKPKDERAVNLDDETFFDSGVASMLEDLRPVETLASNNKKKKKDDTPKEETGSTEVGGGEGGELADEAPIIRIVNTVLLYALRDGASDIHIEPQQKGVRIRYRIDGVLHEQMKIPQYVLNPLISRIKIMSEMNIAERRIPQDGRIKLTMQGKEYDMRVNTCPSMYGEKIVMRVLDKSSVMLGLDKIGLYPEMQAQLLDICTQPNGMLYIAGPTGSGKTTTLYSLLNIVSTIEKNVSTVEDPVEYQLGGITQVQVNRKAGLTFASALRAFLRQDPDIIMVGEIRDLETAEIAVQASLTGHFVLSTIHTNDAPSVPTRLADMGVEPFLISASLTGSLAQRLARRICGNCKEEYVPQREILLRFGFDPIKHPEQKFWRGRGCENCKQTGFKGRMGVYELMRINEEISELIVRRATVAEIKEAARGAGMVTLQEDAFRKCKDGFTTVDEVMRVVFTGGH